MVGGRGIARARQWNARRRTELRGSLRLPEREGRALWREGRLRARSRDHSLASYRQGEEAWADWMAWPRSRPAQTTATSVPPRRADRSSASTAVKLTYDATTTSRAPWTATSAPVPLVVEKSTVLPSTASRANSAGELPKSKPEIASIRRSPASSTSRRSNDLERRMTSSVLSKGMMLRAPLASATAIVVEARSTSTTATTRLATSAAGSGSAPKSTSMRTTRSPAPSGRASGRPRARGTSCPRRRS